MSESQNQKEHRLNLRLSGTEYDKVRRHASSTTCRNLSEYCKKVLLNKPVRVLVRDQSFDDFEEDVVCLLPILDKQSGNFGRLLDSPNSAPALLDAHKEFMTTANQIKELLINIADLCAPK